MRVRRHMWVIWANLHSPHESIMQYFFSKVTVNQIMSTSFITCRDGHVPTALAPVSVNATVAF